MGVRPRNGLCRQTCGGRWVCRRSFLTSCPFIPLGLLLGAQGSLAASHHPAVGGRARPLEVMDEVPR